MRTCIKVLLCVLCSVMVSAAHAADIQPAQGEPIQLPNLDFLQGNKSWVLRDDGQNKDTYTVEESSNGGVMTIHLDESTSGRLKESAYAARRDFPTDAGYYQLQFRAKSDLTKGSAGVRIIAQKEDDSHIQILNLGQGGTPQITAKTSWTDYFVVYQIPENIKRVIFQFEANNAMGEVALSSVALEQLDEETGKSLMQQINPQAETAADYGAKMVATPSRTINAIGSKLIYQPPGLDHSILVINSCTPGEVGSAIFVDYVANKSTVIPMPHGSGGWDIIETSPGKLLFESLSPLHLVTFDTTNGDYKVASDIAADNGATYAWRFAKDDNTGLIYFGSYPTCHAYSYSPATHEIKDLGQIGPEGNLYVRHVAVDDHGFLLCSVSVSEPNIIAYNLKTKEQTIVSPKHTGNFRQVGGRVYTFLDGELQVFDAAQMKFIPVTSPAPPAGEKWRILLNTSTPERMVISATDGVWYECLPNQKPKKIWDMDLQGGEIIGVNEDGNVIGLRGQEYFVAAPQSQDADFKLAATEPVPVSIHFITADPQGGVTGGPSFGQTLFRWDGARDLEQNTGQVVSGGGEVYDGKWVDGKFYFTAYSGGYIGVWDPSQPWDQFHNNNPKTLQQYNKPEWGDLIRPIGGLIVGPQGKLYIGWSAKYGKAGGGLTEYDPATGKSRSWTNDIFAEEMAIGTIATDGKYIYGTTDNHFSGIKPAPKPINFWAFDPATEKVLFTQELSITGGAKVFGTPATGRVWLADAAGVHLFDVEKKVFSTTLKWPKEAGSPSGIADVSARDNKAWIFATNKVVQLEDGENPALKVLFQTEKTGNIAAGDDGNLYYTQGKYLWSVPQ